MTEELVGAANKLARNVLDMTEKALSESDQKSGFSTK